MEIMEGADGPGGGLAPPPFKKRGWGRKGKERKEKGIGKKDGLKIRVRSGPRAPTYP